VILDEAQLIKNVAAQRSHALKRIPKRIGVAVTGTPIENSLTDMWSIFEFVAPEYLGSLVDFEYDYPDEASAAVALSRRLAPLSIRRTVASVATDLPPRVDVVTPVFASGRLENLYDAVRLDPDLAPLARLTKLRQVCAAPSDADPTWERRLTDFPKVDRLIELMESVVFEGAKALVFSSFTESIDQICGALGARFSGLFIRAVDGRKSPSHRQSDIDDFTAATGAAVLVLNPRAAGIGLNIQAASHVFHFTPEWNPAVVSQASARAHRRGQDMPVFIYYLYYVGTVEEVMMDRLDAKRGLQSAGTSMFQENPSAGELARVFALSPKGQN
jgi:SNF2 family DNA or RNA helicase